MNIKALFLLVLGVLIIIFPQYIREYRAYDFWEKVSKEFIFSQRITGIILLILSIIMLAFGIE